MPPTRRRSLPSLPSSPAPDVPRVSLESILRRILALEACLANNTPSRPEGDPHPTHSLWRIAYLTGLAPLSSTSPRDEYWTRNASEEMVQSADGVLYLLKNAVKDAEEMGARRILLVPENSVGRKEMFDKVYKGRIASRCLPTFLDLTNFLKGAPRRKLRRDHRSQQLDRPKQLRGTGPRPRSAPRGPPHLSSRSQQ